MTLTYPWKRGMAGIKRSLMPVSLAFLTLVCGAEEGTATRIQETKAAAEQPAQAANRAFAYLIPPDCGAVAQKLMQKQIAVRVLREDIELDAEAFRITKLTREQRPGQDAATLQIQTERRPFTQKWSAGAFVVRLDQTLGSLADRLLDPQSDECLAATGVFEDRLKEGADYPVGRLPIAVPLLTAPSPAEKPDSLLPITFDVLNGPKAADFNGSPASVTRWLADGTHYLQFKDDQLCKVEAVSGRTEVLYRTDLLAAALGKIEGIDPAAAKRMAEQARQQLDPQAAAAVMEHKSDLYYATLNGEFAVRLTNSQAPEELVSFSPDGQRVAFVRDNDLYVVDVREAKERRLTEKQSATVRNGKADWVYYEEINNRNWKDFAWSPDSQSLAFLQFDDAPVTPFVIANPLEIQQRVETERFPLAGAANPLVRIGIVGASGGDVRWIATDGYPSDNMLISQFGWAPDSRAVYYFVQDRTQRWLDVNWYSLEQGSQKTLFRDQTPAWVNNPGELRFLDDGSFLILSDRDGWQHAYRYATDGKLLGRITDGPWEVRSIQAVDTAGGWVTLRATRDSHLAENAYRVKLDGSELKRLTAEPGTHHISANATGSLFVDSWSSVQQPTRVRLCNAEGQTLRTLDTNPVANLSRYRFAPVEMLQIPLKDGFVVEASIVKPQDFDANKKYPVWLLTYGGPQMPTLSDSWQGGRTFEQMLAQMGIIALRCDPRSASGKGAVNAWKAYRQLGVQELQDLDEVVDWICGKPYVDPSRVGISGHSYGGFLTAFALTHSRRFAAGIAGAPVTDWRNYDSIYTERYMLTPQDNQDGYNRSSVVAAAGDLHGRLLLLHGAMDDNVHMANTLQLAHALQKADKPFEMMIYPPDRHGIFGIHYRRLMYDFIRRTMLEEHGLHAEPVGASISR